MAQPRKTSSNENFLYRDKRQEQKVVTDVPNSFGSTPEFQRFKNVMRKLVAVPKAELDALVRAAKETSPRRGNPRAPGRKRAKRRKVGEKGS